jgi:hypothetical protein
MTSDYIISLVVQSCPQIPRHLGLRSYKNRIGYRYGPALDHRASSSSPHISADVMELAILCDCDLID